MSRIRVCDQRSSRVSSYHLSMLAHRSAKLALGFLLVAAAVASVGYSVHSTLRGLVWENRPQSENVVDLRYNYAPCANPTNCVAGYVSECEPAANAIGCKREYNTGFCAKNADGTLTTRCATTLESCNEGPLCTGSPGSSSSSTAADVLYCCDKPMEQCTAMLAQSGPCPTGQTTYQDRNTCKSECNPNGRFCCALETRTCSLIPLNGTCPAGSITYSDKFTCEEDCGPHPDDPPPPTPAEAAM